MRRGDIVGVPIGGGCVEGMSEGGGMRWSLVGVCSNWKLLIGLF